MPNSLINQTSPYLLQHANNPVNWFAWNDSTLKKAKDEDKMLLISIGYAACHWCHVMEQESFENEEVAKLMNENYVCIKVDREERPDVDQIYMNAAYLISGNGGWPLNAFAMPEGKPFFAGTYFPKDNWINVLQYFAEIYKNERSKLEEQAESLSKGIREIEQIPMNEISTSFDKNDLNEMFSSFEKRIDFVYGGTKGAMKFPMPSVWQFLLQYNHFSENNLPLGAVETTLIHMAKGGIYDHVGGGFSRYATDPRWHVPHFEKMLYDNGQLISLYSKAFQVTANPLYKKVVEETLEFVTRELTSPGCGFFSSLDADSEGEEGKFYVWTQKEIEEILGADAKFYEEYYGITLQGNWEHDKNIPDSNLAKKDFPVNEKISEKIILLNKKLFTEREKRVRPGTDDKMLTSWNALMTKGFIDAYKTFGLERFLFPAKLNINFLLKNICADDNSLFRNYTNGKATIHGFLDDYALLISALIDYYQLTFQEFYLQKANAITKYVIEHFYDNKSGMFFYTDEQYGNLIARKTEVTDNVIPSSNSEMAKNLFLLSLYFDDKDYEQKSLQMIKNVYADLKPNLNYYSNWAQVLILHLFPVIEVLIVGKDWKEKLQQLQKKYLPNVIYSGGDEEGSLSLLEDKLVKGKTLIYVCKNKSCRLPVEKVSEALNEIILS